MAALRQRTHHAPRRGKGRYGVTVLLIKPPSSLFSCTDYVRALHTFLAGGGRWSSRTRSGPKGSSRSEFVGGSSASHLWYIVHSQIAHPVRCYAAAALADGSFGLLPSPTGLFCKRTLESTQPVDNRDSPLDYAAAAH